jgi:AraC-like DNA-binding protein
VVREPIATVPAVADALRHITITGVFYCPSYLREPWGGTVPAMPGCVWFHAVTSGRCDLVVGDDRVALQSGDLALVPHGAGHRIEAGGPTEHPSIPDLPHEQQSDNYAVLRYGGDGPLTELVCGGLRLEHPSARRLLDSLPPVVHIRTVRRTVLGATLDLLAEEVQGREVGGEAVISRLCDVLVIQAIRHWMTTGEATGSRWLHAMGDAQIGPALAALHAAPGAPWTVGTLASRAAMSRSAFAARFRELVGQPVMGYLTELRMQLAVDLLHRSDRTVAEVATAVGYESDASFSRVFKRHLGSSPREARRAG